MDVAPKTNNSGWLNALGCQLKKRLGDTCPPQTCHPENFVSERSERYLRLKLTGGTGAGAGEFEEFVQPEDEDDGGFTGVDGPAAAGAVNGSLDDIGVEFIDWTVQPSAGWKGVLP
jgi:hypothetical protein